MPAAGDETRTVHVVCSLFHPGEHLDRQLETILDQTYAVTRLWLRDDAGDDDTRERIDAWQRRDSRVGRVDGGGRLGTPASYGVLIQHALDAGADWIALADQDDEWRPTHLADSLATAGQLHDDARPTLHSAGQLHDDAQPMLVHGDLELIDAASHALAPSFFAHQRIRHEPREPLRVLAVQNFVTGCATVLNRPLAEMALPIPEAAVMHDWWLALCAAAAGRVVARDTTTVRYRQHDQNQIGAQPYGEVVRDLGARTIRMQRHSAEPFIETLEQARALLHRLAEPAATPRDLAVESRITESRHFLERYLALFERHVPRWRRAFGLARLGVGRQDRLLDLSLKAKLLTTSVELAPEPERRATAKADIVGPPRPGEPH